VNILLISGYVETRQFLRSALLRHGFRLKAVGSRKQALTGAPSGDHDLILIDLEQKAGYDGIAVIRQIRKRRRTPVIVLCRRNDEASIRSALDCGADDYVIKPFTVSNLVARMRSIVRRALPVHKNIDISTAS